MVGYYVLGMFCRIFKEGYALHEDNHGVMQWKIIIYDLWLLALWTRFQKYFRNQRSYLKDLFSNECKIK